MSAATTKVSLPEICELVTDGTHDSPKLQPSGVPFIKGRHISSGRIDFADCDYITEQDHLKCIRRVKPQTNDVLFSNIGSVGDAARVPDVTEFSIKNVALFRPNPEKVDPLFFYYLVISPYFRGHFLNVRSGSAQPFISLENFRSLRFNCLKNKTAQQRIGHILSAYDDLIENNRRRIQLLEQAARLLYREWFVYFRFPGHEHATITDGVPEGWGKKTVLEVIEIKPKEAVPKGTPIRYVPMTCLSTTGMTVDLSDAEVRTKSTSVRYRNGDILFARITPCLENGKTGFVNFLREDEVACGSTEFIVLRGSSVSPYFAYCLARTHDFRETAIKSMIGSSGRQRVQPSCFDDFIVARPPRFLRDEFDRVCESIFSQIAGLSSQVQSLTQARDLLLPRLMNGEVAV